MVLHRPIECAGVIGKVGSSEVFVSARRAFSMLEILADQAIVRGRARRRILGEFATLRATSDSGANSRITVAGEPTAAGRGFMACCEASRISSMRPRTLNLESSEETWNLTGRTGRFRSQAISLLARLRRMPS